jgi:hypothetical protein
MYPLRNSSTMMTASARPTHPRILAFFIWLGVRLWRVPSDANRTNPTGESKSQRAPPKNQSTEKTLTMRSKLIPAIEYQS